MSSPLPENSATATRFRLPRGKHVGEGPGPLGHAEDRKVWTINEFGLRIYAAKGYVVMIEGRCNGRWQEIQVDPGAVEFRAFIEALKQARFIAQGYRKPAAGLEPAIDPREDD